MHNRVGPNVDSREIGFRDLAALVPLVGVILVLAFYPQFVLKRSEPTVRAEVGNPSPPTLATASTPGGRTAYARVGGTP